MRPPVFVVGLGRSGTTLTARILDRHSHISLCGETHFFPHTSRRRRRARFSDQEAREILDELPMTWAGADPDDVLATFRSTDRLLRSLFDSILRARMRRHGKVRYGEKTPIHFWYLDRLFEWYPDARLVYLVRDPRRVHDSFLRSHFAPGLRAIERGVVPRALYWNHGARTLGRVRATRPDQVFTLRFEDLVADPEASVRALCAFLDEPFESGMLEVTGENSSFGDLGERGGIQTQVLTRPFGLPRRTLAALEILCGAEMIKQGYEPEWMPRGWIAMLDKVGFYAATRALQYAARKMRGRP
ncbi:MAG: sulfotransferase [Gemmatimonadota bacterium]